MTHQTIEERMLESLIEAARNEPQLEVDAALLEQAIHKKWMLQSVTRSPRPFAWRWAIGVAFAASVSVAGLIVHGHWAIKSHDADTQSSQGLVKTDLQPGQVIATDEQAITVVHRNIARWTLAPHGRAQLSAQAPYLTVSLQAGSVEADVVPSRQSESFAIETNGRRVAVHGTRFSVEHQADSTIVEVRSGSVVVGTPGRPGHTEGTLLTAPQKVRFPLVERVTRLPSVTGSDETESVAPHKPKTNVGTAALATSNASDRTDVNHETQKLPQGSSPIEQETALDVVRAAAARCFVQAKANDDRHESNVSVRVETHLTVVIAPSGYVQDTIFSPPIPGEITECTRREIATWSTTRTEQGATTARSIILTK